MAPKRIFFTGASGCIGHYIAETLIDETDCELFLLVRDRRKLKFDCNARPGIKVIEADLREIERFAALLKTIDVAILAANAWGGPQEVFDVNVVKTIRLLNLLDPQVCEQAIYFSTASILDRDNRLLKQASEIGTDYIRSKYDCLTQLPRLAIAPKLTVLFPTLVFGGGPNKPISHLSSGIPTVVKWAGIARWLKVDASFHFLHAKDIAQIVRHLITTPPPPNPVAAAIDDILLKQLVLGNPALTANQLVRASCQYLGKRVYWQMPISSWLADVIIKIFDIQMAPWDRFCMQYRHFTYRDPVSPATYGLVPYCATIADVLRASGVPEKRRH
ncbi:MAG: NAD(P)-dependent oxidoreductase [Spirulinaceae cyanobacterium RM2_2_10]|nr:NAD(P)-dependent oxidoreductase [Spirulinaceae cyanobacterium SM2_1_0]NJO21005.1 NAD(P)-dependent oxidoreductase [Spirulinaceae cyanobacterium RM2_2_10]